MMNSSNHCIIIVYHLVARSANKRQAHQHIKSCCHTPAACLLLVKEYKSEI